MNKFDLMIEGPTVINVDNRQRGNIYIRDQRIVHIGYLPEATAQETIPATGLVAIPGRVESHVHFMDPAEIEREDFITGSAAAAVGGATTVIEHTHAMPIRTSVELDEKRAYLRDRSYVDFGLAAHVWPDLLGALPDVWRSGAAYFKIFTCTTHGVPGFTNSELLQAFREIAKLAAPVLIHCEDETITTDNLARLHEKAAAEIPETLREGRGAAALPNESLSQWRSREAEMTAINSVGLLARLTGVKAVIAHASHANAVDLAAWHRAAGADLSVETCPHYLYLLEDEVIAQGALRKFTPPARARSSWELQEMWRRAAFGPITYISSDHAPATAAQKAIGVWDAPFGLPGVETTLPLLLDGVCQGYLSWERLVDLTALQPAKLYGLYPRKGALSPGSDADVVLVDPQAKYTFRDERVVSKAGWTPFAGRTVTGLPTHTFVRGRLVAESGRPVGEPGWGQFLAGRGRVDR